MKIYRNQYSKWLLDIVLILSIAVLPLSIIAQNRGAKITDNSSGSSHIEPKDIALLELDSSQKGFLFPRMTTAERDAINVDQFKDSGLIIFNLTTDCIEYYNSDIHTWVSLCGDTPPSEVVILPTQCSAIKVVGEYYANRELGQSNGIVMTVTTSIAGSYEMRATSENGYSFEAKGRFPATGTFSVYLKGDGKPKVGYDSNANGLPSVKGDKLSITINNKPISCEVYNFVNQDMPSYKLKSAVANGRYFTAEDVTSAETVTVIVDVLRKGHWIMKSTKVNGVEFYGEGVFESPGEKTVTLKASGKANKVGDNAFTIVSNSANSLGGPVASIDAIYNGEGPLFNVVNCGGASFSKQIFVSELIPSGTTMKVFIKVLAPGKDLTIRSGFSIGNGGPTVWFRTENINLNYNRNATGPNANVQEITLTVLEANRNHGADVPSKRKMFFIKNDGFKDYECTTNPAYIEMDVLTRIVSTITFNSPFISVTSPGKMYIPPYTNMVGTNASRTNLEVEFYAGGNSGSVNVASDIVNGIKFSGSVPIGTDGVAKGTLSASGIAGESQASTDSKFTVKRLDKGEVLGEINVDFVYRRMKLVSYGQRILFGGTSGKGSEYVDALLNNKEIFGWDGLVRIDGFEYIDPSGTGSGYLNSSSTSLDVMLKNQLDKADIVASFASFTLKNNNKLDILYQYLQSEKFALIYADRYSYAIKGGNPGDLSAGTVYFMKKFDLSFNNNSLTGQEASNITEGLTMNYLAGNYYAKLYDSRFLVKYPVSGKTTMISTVFGLADTGDAGENSMYVNTTPTGFEALYRRGNTTQIYGFIHKSQGIIFIGNHRPLFGTNTGFRYSFISPLVVGGVNNNEPAKTTFYGSSSTNTLEVHNAYHLLNIMYWSIDYAQKNRIAK